MKAADMTDGIFLIHIVDALQETIDFTAGLGLERHEGYGNMTPRLHNCEKAAFLGGWPFNGRVALRRDRGWRGFGRDGACGRDGARPSRGGCVGGVRT